MALTAQDMMIWLRAKDETGPAFASAQRGMTSVKSGVEDLKGALAAVGVGLSAAGITQWIRGAVDDLAKVGDVASRVNATTDAVQALQAQLRLNGGEAADAERALQKFAIASAEVGQNQNYLTKIFAANGVALREQNGQMRSSDALLQEYARLVANATDQQTKLLLTQEAFGKQAGPNMVAVLEEIARVGLQGVIDQGKATGVVLENDVIKKAQELDRAFKQLEIQGAAGMKKLAIEWAPTLLEVFQTLRGVVKDVAYDIENIKAGNWRDVLGIYSSDEEKNTARRKRYATTGLRTTLSPSDQEVYAQGDAYASAWYTPNMNLSSPNGGANPAGNNGKRTVMPPRTDPQNRSAEVLRILEAEGDALTLNVEKRLEAERIEARINAVRRAGKDASEADKEAIRGAVDALYAKKKAFEEMKRAQDGFNDAAKFGGDQFLNVIEAATDKTKSLQDAMNGVTKAIIQATLRAALLGEGPLAGILGMKGQDGNMGGLLGSLLNPFSPSTKWDAGATGANGAIPDANAWAGLLPGRAVGGPVSKGRGYMVGEHGPEPFFPDEDGIILPNGFRGSGGSQTVVQVINNSGQKTRETRSTGPDGKEIVRIIVGEEMAAGGFDGVQRAKFGNAPRGVQR